MKKKRGGRKGQGKKKGERVDKGETDGSKRGKVWLIRKEQATRCCKKTIWEKKGGGGGGRTSDEAIFRGCPRTVRNEDEEGYRRQKKGWGKGKEEEKCRFTVERGRETRKNHSF